jgi:hypothetical protein
LTGELIYRTCLIKFFGAGFGLSNRTVHISASRLSQGVPPPAWASPCSTVPPPLEQSIRPTKLALTAKSADNLVRGRHTGYYYFLVIRRVERSGGLRPQIRDLSAILDSLGQDHARISPPCRSGPRARRSECKDAVGTIAVSRTTPDAGPAGSIRCVRQERASAPGCCPASRGSQDFTYRVSFYWLRSRRGVGTVQDTVVDACLNNVHASSPRCNPTPRYGTSGALTERASNAIIRNYHS